MCYVTYVLCCVWCTVCVVMAYACQCGYVYRFMHMRVHTWREDDVECFLPALLVWFGLESGPLTELPYWFSCADGASGSHITLLQMQQGQRFGSIWPGNLPVPPPPVLSWVPGSEFIPHAKEAGSLSSETSLHPHLKHIFRVYL